MKSFKWIVVSLAVTLLLSSCKFPLIGGGVEVGNGAKPAGHVSSDSVPVSSPDRNFAISYSKKLTFSGDANTEFTLDNSKVVKAGEPVSTLKFQTETVEGSLNSVDDLRNKVVKKNHYAIADQFQNINNLIPGSVGLYFESVTSGSSYSDSAALATNAASEGAVAAGKQKIGHYYFINEKKEVLHFTANAFEAGNGLQLIFPVVYNARVASPTNFPLVGSAAEVSTRVERLEVEAISVRDREVKSGTSVTVEVKLSGEGSGLVGGRIAANVTTVRENELVSHNFAGPITSSTPKDGKSLYVRVNLPKEIRNGKYFISTFEIMDKAENFVKFESKEVGPHHLDPRDPTNGLIYFKSSSYDRSPKPDKQPIATFLVSPSEERTVPTVPSVRP